MSEALLAVFDEGSARSLAKDRSLFRVAEPVRFMFLVMDGQVDLIRHTLSGDRVLLMRAGPGCVLAEASAYSDIYHCEATAAAPARLMAISVGLFRQKLDQNVELANAWAAQLAHGLQAARLNLAIRTMRTVGERLDAWLAEGRPLPPKGQWQDVAQSLGVTREALYRELAKRGKPGSR